MRTASDVEAYLLKMNRKFRAVDDQPGMFLVDGAGAGLPSVAVRVDPPLVVVRVHIGKEAPDSDPAHMSAFYRRLLELNARELVHTSYGVDQGRVVLSSALELENLDYNELAAALDEIDVTLAQQVPALAELSKASSVRPNVKGKA